ncbi:hypothetical protein QTN47_17005 [Danxiaibacter flavus]|uniref:DUF1360 domain-containing protein n=1 Tax=Danxiaibacter flavus TaxID=3049108 RepID=A0ABV3ZH33_9BACT|nr:hypothetical protein QNM32_17015 [Chitinophagaceae bacterium DXS]
MKELLLYSLIIVLKNTTAYMLFKQGMLLGRIRIASANFLDKIFDWKTSRVVQKPLWDCLICMSSIWTVFWMALDGKTNVFAYLNTMLIVGGFAAIITSLIEEHVD